MNGPLCKETVCNGWKCLEWPGMPENSYTWLEMARTGWKWPEMAGMARNGKNWLIMAGHSKNGLKWLKMAWMAGKW